MILIAVLPFLLLLVSPLFRPTADAGEPALKGYADFDAFRVEMESIATSPLAGLESLTRTPGGRDVLLLRIGTGELDKKPAVLVVGSVHGPHLLGSELATRMARRLVESVKGKDSAAAKKLLDRTTFYFIPRPTPDACEAFFRRPQVERTGNDRSFDDDRDGRTDEDGPEDLNGDGLITMMRVADPGGEYTTHEKDARLMAKVQRKRPSDRPRYRLLIEGRDNDHDRRQAEDGPGGVDFNRNFTFRYPYFSAGAGPHQVSEPETRAVADFAFDRPNIAAVLTFTPQDNMMHPWKAKDTSSKIKTDVLSEDAQRLDYIAEEYRKINNQSASPPSPDGAGSFSHWAYFHYGRWSFACRGWWIPQVEKRSDKKQDKSKVEKTTEKDKEKSATPKEKAKEDKDEQLAHDLNALAWFDREKVDGFVPWKPVSHPDFPDRKVEVGGFRPFLRLNPPAKLLDDLARRHERFLRKLAEMFSRVKIDRIKTEPLGGDVWRVTAVVVNHGYLPTVSKMGEFSRQTQSLQIALDVPKDAKLLTGTARSRLPRLEGNGGRTEKVWLVRLPVAKAKPKKPQSMKVRVWSPSVGRTAKTVKLKLLQQKKK